MKSYQVHPLTYKHFKLGNPYVTRDEYTAKFNPKEVLIHLKYKDSHLGVYLHDASHPQIKARYWGKHSENQLFDEQLISRIKISIQKRKITKRNNYYLVYSEFDQLPGLFITHLNGVIFIQYACNVYERFLPDIITQCFQSNPCYTQFRPFKSNPDLARKVKPDCPETVVISENNYSLQADFKWHYDIGLYTDLAQYRTHFKPPSENQKVLNLFSYTGAWSIWAASAGAKVQSVDTSKRALRYFAENIKINHQDQLHQTSEICATEALLHLSQYDLVIVDPPPSFTTGGGKKISQDRFYQDFSNHFKQFITGGGRVILIANALNFKTNLLKNIHPNLQLVLTAECDTDHEMFGPFAHSPIVMSNLK